MSNPHTGSRFDEFLDEEGLILPSELEALSKEEKVELEELVKRCPRCSGKSANPSNPAGRCRKHLNKLAKDKKTPGHWQRSQTLADDSLRRQAGKNGTAHKKHKGLGSRKEIVNKMKSAEKKTGQRLSPDRIDNKKGYKSSNVRAVPVALNRGRHKVDPKKLAAWKKNLKKNGLELDDLKTLMTAHAYDTGREELAKMLELFDHNFLEPFFDDIDDSKKKIENLAKEAAQKLHPSSHEDLLMPHIGKTHTVEIHPDIDHLYNVKGFIKESGKPHIHIGDLKSAQFPKDIVKKVPRDAHGKVTAEMIDKHIESLPKHKVDVHIQPYTWGAQQHREHHGQGQQYVATMHMHPEHQDKMDEHTKQLWETVKDAQHQFGKDGGASKDHQFGWARLDPYIYHGDNVVFPSDNHLHVDEIQSDFNNKDKIKSRTHQIGQEANYSDDETFNASHPGKTRKQVQDWAEKVKNKNGDLLNHLSHGHEDPQHAIHSAVNALGRKLGAKSMSMDTPEDQAHQSGLDTDNSDENDHTRWMDDNIDPLKAQYHDHRWSNDDTKDLINNSNKNPNFEIGLEKIGGLDALQKIAGSFYHIGDYSTEPEIEKDMYGPKIAESFKNLTIPQKDALNDFLRRYQDAIHDEAYNQLTEEYPGPRERSSEDEDNQFNVGQLPVHQQQTYYKRPKKLGMKEVPKADVLGNDPNDKAKNVQYMKLHKTLQAIRDLVKKHRKQSV